MRTHFIQHVPYESPAYLLQWATRQQHVVSFTKMYEAVSFPDPADIDWLVVMGGPMGVYEEDKYPWLKTEKAFIRAVMNAGKKVLGVCLGSQLVAEALGSKVYPHTEKEIGWWPVQKMQHGNGSALLHALPDQFTAFHWHGDTFDLPAGALHLLKTDLCANQAFACDNRIMGLQFHLEVTPELVAAMTKYGMNELHAPTRGIQPAEALLRQQDHYAASQAHLEKLLTAFLYDQ